MERGEAKERGEDRLEWEEDRPTARRATIPSRECLREEGDWAGGATMWESPVRWRTGMYVPVREPGL